MGLALALRLAKEGQHVTLLEARSTLGGLADAWSVGDVRWDRHYHVTLLSDSNLLALLKDLGLESELNWVETKTGFYTGGQFYSMSNTAEFLAFPPLTLMEKLRLGGTIFLGSKIRDWRRLERQTVESWLRRWSGPSTFRKIWLPLLRAKLGDAYQRVSAAFIWSYISRMYKARRTGLKKEMFGYVRGGYGRILDVLQEALDKQGVDIRLESRISRIGSGVDELPQIAFQDGDVETFDHVVVTTPSSVVAKICEGMDADELARHESIEYLGIVCASVLLKRPLRGFYVTNITDEVPFTAVIEMTTIVPPEELDGHTLIYLPKYATQDDDVFLRSDEEVRQTFLDALFRMYPELKPSDVVDFRISRVRNVVAIPTVEYSRRLPPIVSSIPQVYVINSAHILKGNLNVNETVGLANEAFDDYLAPLVTSAASLQPAV